MAYLAVAATTADLAHSAYHMAVSLGAGGEALLGYALGKLAGRGGGSTTAAACPPAEDAWSAGEPSPAAASSALGAASKAVALMPLHPAAHHVLGCVLGGRGERAGAAEHFRIALELLDSWGGGGARQGNPGSVKGEPGELRAGEGETGGSRPGER